MKNIPFKIIMSRGDEIKIDCSELPKVLSGISSGSPVMVKTGIFNPSFYVSIVRDEERVDQLREDVKFLSLPNQEKERDETIEKGPKELEDMFADIRELVTSTKMIKN